MTRGYFRFPAVYKSKIVFTSEDDLWEAPLEGGAARRLTAGRGSCLHPHFSPDGRFVAFASAEEGHNEVYVMPSEGGDIRRLTYLGALSIPCGWLDAETVLFRSTAYEAHNVTGICSVGAAGGLPRSLQLGPSSSLVLSETGKAVLARWRSDPSHWKRYRGGTAGRLWIAPALDGEYEPLITLNGNLASPVWVGARVYFVSDHEGMGNLYSCTAEGGDLRLDAAHEEFYIRNPSTDGQTIVYHAGGDLYALDVASRTSRKLAIDYHSQRTQRQRRYIQAAKYLEAADLDPKGERGVYVVRGQIHHMRHWDGPVSCQAVPGSRYRLARFLADGRRVIAVIDRENGDEGLEIWDSQNYSVTPVPVPPENSIGTEGWGRFTLLQASPKGEHVAFANHRNELWLLDLATGAGRKLAANPYGVMGIFAWSPDGRWLAFQQSQSRDQSTIAIASVETGEIRAVTEPLFTDYAPSFDPDGRYLYFLSNRVLNPVYDAVQFELSFPKAVLPYLVTLRKDTPSPFLETATDEKDNGGGEGKDKELKIEIDFDGISSRILAFPVPEGRYATIAGLKKKAMWLCYPVKGALVEDWTPEPPPPEGTLEAYDFKKLKVETLGHGISASGFRRTESRCCCLPTERSAR